MPHQWSLLQNIFLIGNKSLLKIKDPQNEFLLKHSLVDNLGMTHLKYSQTYNGIEVWGKEVIVHLDAQGNIVSLNGSYESTPSTITDLKGNLDQSKAINQATSDLQTKDGIEYLSPIFQKLFGYNGPAAKRIIWYDENHVPHLVWNVEVIPGLQKIGFILLTQPAVLFLTVTTPFALTAQKLQQHLI